MQTYGLLGQSLSHSYSPALHGLLGDYPYVLFEKEEAELGAFLHSGSFQGLNVTNPYKQAVIPYLALLSPLARSLSSVNTIYRLPDGRLAGDNTDYPGFLHLLQAHRLSPSGKKILVLGSGGAARTVQAVLSAQGGEPLLISRSRPEHYGNLSRRRDATWIINATPVGMYPRGDEMPPLSLEDFPGLECVIDLIYNPLRSALLMEAKNRDITAINGLSMLAAQGLYASRLWGQTDMQENDIPALTRALQQAKENIVLIGMPGSGKSTRARQLGQQLGRPVYDSDEAFTQQEGITPEAFIARQGENAFRAVESRILARLGALSGVVIATGGGAVTRPENYPLLHQNGRILWVKRPVEQLDISAKPLFHRKDLAALYEERRPLYEAWADEIIHVM